MNETIPASKSELRELLAGQLGVDAEEIAEDDNLVDWGMNSITAMKLANRWQRAGAPVAAKDLISKVTLDGWWSVLTAR